MEGSGSGSGFPFFNPSGHHHHHHHHHQPASSSSSSRIVLPHHLPAASSSSGAVFHPQPATASAGSILLVGVANPAAGHGGAQANPEQNQRQQRAVQRVMMREPDQYMPIANIIRIMRRILPPHAKISDEAKETIQECVSEYISFVTNEANQRCREEQRKTVTADDLLWAMDKLGFDRYVGPLSLYLNRYRNGNGGGSSSHYVPRVPPPPQQVPPLEIAQAVPLPLPPSYYYGSGYSYPVVAPNQMGASASRAGSSSSGGSGGGAGGDAQVAYYYDPFAHLRNDRC